MKFEDFLIVFILVMLFVLMFLLFTVLILKPILSDESDYIDFETKCYDKNNNEIEGLTCLEEVYCGDNVLLKILLEDCEDKSREIMGGEQ